ncbi:hypothetical protein GF366_04965 [Candidatus Peregrinibacteria bacterium]|nr:hypothetical protein [Candidatus Peregrinibacteria bacterium]
MKKILALYFLITAFVFCGCSLGNFFINDVEIHNSLVEKMDAVLLAEEKFYEEYWVLEENGDNTSFIEAYKVFKKSVEELDRFFGETEFVSAQKAFVEKYRWSYKPFVENYVNYAGDLAGKVENEEYSFGSIESYFDQLDEYTVDYVAIHNDLIDVINEQSDYPNK